MKLLIINGPNLNLLGKREPHIYGGRDFEAYLRELRERYSDITIDYYQSNVEGELINALQVADGQYDGVILNAGGYTHTSVALADAVGAIEAPVVEVHISCILAREEFRHTSLIAPRCRGTIMGFGLESYRLGVESFIVII
jgi:3-dehydroquinate dehydratase-2